MLLGLGSWHEDDTRVQAVSTGGRQGSMLGDSRWCFQMTEIYNVPLFLTSSLMIGRCYNHMTCCLCGGSSLEGHPEIERFSVFAVLIQGELLASASQTLCLRCQQIRHRVFPW